MGLDPGLERVGFGVIEKTADGAWAAVDWGVIKTSKHDRKVKRLADIETALKALIEDIQPQAMAIEQLFFFRNFTTMAPVSEARGVMLLACHRCGFDPMEFTPLQVKQAITGSGKAQKDEVQVMVATLLGMDGVPKPDDAADALAIAIALGFELQAHPEPVTLLSSLQSQTIEGIKT